MIVEINPFELIPTHRLMMSPRAFSRFKEMIRTDGRLRVPVKFVEYQGSKYIVDGHHRTRAAKELGFATIPAERVELPFQGYRVIEDLFHGG
jgi:ParB-like chromosome segregation protein Spo0J